MSAHFLGQFNRQRDEVETCIDTIECVGARRGSFVPCGDGLPRRLLPRGRRCCAQPCRSATREIRTLKEACITTFTSEGQKGEIAAADARRRRKPIRAAPEKPLFTRASCPQTSPRSCRWKSSAHQLLPHGVRVPCARALQALNGHWAHLRPPPRVRPPAGKTLLDTLRRNGEAEVRESPRGERVGAYRSVYTALVKRYVDAVRAHQAAKEGMREAEVDTLVRRGRIALGDDAGLTDEELRAVSDQALAAARPSTLSAADVTSLPGPATCSVRPPTLSTSSAAPSPRRRARRPRTPTWTHRPARETSRCSCGEDWRRGVADSARAWSSTVQL